MNGFSLVRLRATSGDLPLIFAVIERLRLHHVVRRVQRRLEPEQIARIAQVPADVGGHRRERLEDRRPKIARTSAITGSLGSAMYASTVPSYASITTFTLLRM